MKSNETANQWEITIRFGFLSLIFLGFLYPLTISGLAKSFFPFEANGSLSVVEGKVVGSELLAQKVLSKSLFRYRPSAASYATIPSGASNLSPSSLDLRNLVEDRKHELETAGISIEECLELVYASASGLDPHITARCAYEQAKSIEKKVKIPLNQINELILKHTEYPLFGFIGRERVNVTKLNLSWSQMIHE
ncbi:potassium-transporting ATPase subunit C [Leptospira vanthielii]|uniref:Potassium-transporting ATPase KdpC subunit n=1 Tax=Leptospira vanthielii serovar Holland str. Waz Holland = ATCC 700522 TaxID=1218591 RepID=N1WDD2_9LEPT|nr:potassium-transporting ATPase subunit C [Leptospira vanthielii]EMY69891.1 putative K+-transporting ATPase, C subunit [Leptospira vanthielii serovar Holland str. Waz Holland = ATCC 700522]